MATFLILEDDDNHAKSIKYALESEGHQGESLVRPSFNVLKQVAVEYLQDVDEREPIDFLILDIHEHDDDFGGLRAYAAIIAAGLRRRFKHLLICSKWIDAQSQMTAGYGALRGFSIACDVPESNFLPKWDRRNPRLFERIKELMVSGQDPSVHVIEPWKNRRKSESS